MSFSHLRLSEPLLRAVAAEGYSIATPIQASVIPHALEGRDVLGSAQTGTGKTAAFALPILQRLSEASQAPAANAGHSGHAGHNARPASARCLVLCPTRELATQIAEGFRVYGKNLRLRQVVIFGGVSQDRQVKDLRRGTDIIVATPGRLLDLMNQRLVDLRGIDVLVLDEADRMLDMGFIRDIREIISHLQGRKQTMLFSATMPKEIRTLADTLLRDPVVVQIAPPSATAEGIDESVYFVERKNKPALLAHLVDHLPMTRAIVFSRTKHGADRIVRQLHIRGIAAEALHGNKTQSARQRALDNFRVGKTPLLVATDIASRGIDVDGITHVVNYDLTHEPETYVHRIGRTARAGSKGAAVSFCDRDEMQNLRAIERLLRRSISVMDDQPEYAAEGHAAAPRAENPRAHVAAPARDREAAPHADRQPHSQQHSQPHAQPHSKPHSHRGAPAESGKRHGQRTSSVSQGSHGSHKSHLSQSTHPSHVSSGSHGSRPSRGSSASQGSRPSGAARPGGFNNRAGAGVVSSGLKSHRKGPRSPQSFQAKSRSHQGGGHSHAAGGGHVSR